MLCYRFVNRHDLDFAGAANALPAQTIELNEDTMGELDYPLAYVPVMATG